MKRLPTTDHPGPGRYYVIDAPKSLDARIGGYLFRSEWWSHVPPQAWLNQTHAHVDLEMSHVNCGEGALRAGGRNTKLRQGCIVVSRPGDEHRVSSSKGKRLGLDSLGYSIHLASPGGPPLAGEEGADRQVRAFLSCPDRVRSDNPEGDLGMLFKTVRWSMEGRFPGWRETAGAAVKALILSIMRLFAPLQSPLPEPPEKGKWAWLDWSETASRDDTLSDRVNDYVIRHFPEDLRIEDAARATGVSVRKIQRRLDSLGYNFRSLLHGIRIEMARYLLISSNLSVEQVARQVGMTRLSNFSWMFRKKFRMSPLRYRALIKRAGLPSGRTRDGI